MDVQNIQDLISRPGSWIVHKFSDWDLHSLVAVSST